MLGNGARDEHRVADAFAEPSDRRRHRTARERMTHEHDLIEAGRVDVGHDRIGARPERHGRQGRGTAAAAREIDRDRGAVEQRRQPVPAAVVEAAAVHEDERDHRARIMPSSRTRAGVPALCSLNI